MRGPDYQTWRDWASSPAGPAAGSVTGMPSSVLAEIGRRTLPTGIGRGTVVKSKGAGDEAGAVIVQEADRVGQAIPAQVIAARLRQAGGHGHRGQDGGGSEEFQSGHRGISWRQVLEMTF